VDRQRFSSIARAIEDDQGPPVLDRLVVAIAELLDTTAVGIVVVDDGQQRGSVAVSAPLAAEVDDLQFSLGEGPCLDADRTSRPVVEPDLAGAEASGQWPAFAPAAVQAGACAAFAFPLVLGAARLGALSLYRDREVDLDDRQFEDALFVGRIVTTVMLELEVRSRPGDVPDRLHDVLDHRAQVHQATGMVSAQLGVDVATALGRLRAAAWAEGVPLEEVAAEVVARRRRFDEQ
jgi:hypothetical protein